MRHLTPLSLLLVLGLWLGSSERILAADFPTGTFTTKVNDAEWSVTFDGKGNYTVKRDDKARLTGKYKITKDVVEFTDLTGEGAGKDEEKVATYKWKLDGKNLVFTKVKDANKGRESVVTSGPWTPKK